MALFKIMKGSKDRLDNQQTHEGYAWYTTEDGGFYIDAANVDSQGQDTGSVVRKRVNAAAQTSFDNTNTGMSATTVQEAIVEANKSFTYDANTKTLEFS